MPPRIEVVHQVRFVDAVVLAHFIIEQNPLRLTAQIALVISVADRQVEEVQVAMKIVVALDPPEHQPAHEAGDEAVAVDELAKPDGLITAELLGLISDAAARLEKASVE